MEKSMRHGNTYGKELRMNKSDGGFSTPLAMTAIFSLSLVILSLSMLVAANGRKLKSYKNFVLARKEADAILSDLKRDFQILKDVPCDSDSSAVLHGILARYSEYDLTITDVSTGIHRNFMNENFYDSKPIRDYMAMEGEAAVTEYGWISPKYADKEILDGVIADFEGKTPFPIVNTFPPYNIHFMSCGFLEAVLEHCGIKNAEENAKKTVGLISDETDIESLAEIIGVAETHPVFDFIGVKTAFWKILFGTRRCGVSAIFAAVPKKDDQRSVERYILIDKKISHEGRAL